MQETDSLPESPEERLELALDLTWKVVKSKYEGGRINITREAPLQHQYAQALSQLGSLFTIHRHEHWIVDLEVREQDLIHSGHSNYIDVVCEIQRQGDDPVKAAVEMKFKDTDRGAPQTGVQSLYDIYTLEQVLENGYDVGRFVLATNNKYLWMQPVSSEIRQRFGIYDGRQITAGDRFVAENTTAQNVLQGKTPDQALEFTNNYEFEWDGDGEFRFLSVAIS